MKSKKIKIIAALVCCNMMIGNVCVAFAAEKSSEKEEVVYAIMDNDGQVTGVYVVNSFKGGNILDYGDYKSVKNLTGTEPIVQSNDKISLSSNSDMVYYQGDLKSLDIPWKIDINYYIDEKEYSADEIAGKSGKLKIKMAITQNKKCDESFWKGYALQGTVQLDSSKCTNIIAEDGTVANVGGNKQISYIILPGKEKEIEITADVKDFEMTGITINGIKLNMDLDVNSNEISSKLTEIKDAAVKLDDGAKTLKEGSSELSDGSKKLTEGSNNLNNGASTLKNGALTLNNGIGEMKDALDKLNSNSNSLNTGSVQTLNALITIQNSLNNISEINEYIDKHNQLINSLEITNTQRVLYNAYVSGGDGAVITKISELVQTGDGEATELYTKYIQNNQDATVIQDYIEISGKLINAESLLKGDIMYINGSNALISGIQESLDSESGELMKGALLLQSNYTLFNDNISLMVDSLKGLTDNMATLKNAIDTLTYNYKTLDTGIGNYTSGVNEIVKGYNKIYAGSISIVDGTSALYDGTNNMVSGVNSLYEGVQALENGSNSLAEGTSEFRNRTQNMDSEVEDTIENAVVEVTGKDEKTISFVSDKNENVDSVLFVMKTPSIEKKEVQEKQTNKKENTSIIKKFLKLFNLD